MDSEDTTITSIKSVGDVIHLTHNCSICFATCKNKTYVDPCLHAFCYSCIVTWSRRRSVCPLCVREFDSIIHNVRKVNDFDRTMLKFSGLKYIFLVPTISNEEISSSTTTNNTIDIDAEPVPPVPGTLFLLQEYATMLNFASLTCDILPKPTEGQSLGQYAAFKEIHIVRSKEADTVEGELEDKVAIKLHYKGDERITVVLQAPIDHVRTTEPQKVDFLRRHLLQRVPIPKRNITEIEIAYDQKDDCYVFRSTVVPNI